MSAKRSTVVGKTKTQLEEAPENNEVPQRKPLSLEAKRILNMLENCISGVEFVAMMPALLQLNTLSSVGDKDLSMALQEHQLLEKRLETFECLMQGSDGEQGREVGKAMARLEKDIKNSLRDLLRLARAHPDAISGLKAELGETLAVGESEYKLITGLEKFQSCVVETLLTSVEEELHDQLDLQKSSYQNHRLEILALKQEKQAISMEQQDAEIFEKNEEIKRCQGYLEDNNRRKAGISLLPVQQSQVHTASKMKKAGKTIDIDQPNILLSKLIFENRQAERVIQEKIEKVETEIENLLYTFDTEMEEKQAKLDLNRMDYEKEDEELKTLEKLFSVLEVECNQIKEKRRLAEEKRKEEAKELELKTKAAVMAQACR
ncbi:Dynein regulatory complex protein 10 [Dissostichus eleginoides]|uniref:Dynein regulatory complex protein 10 n=1 Tax=Dissostichus eleginoides TaxID=100907 RepID=A0AAD9C0D9_DISEL|nr:Dynein regulatory complex protein 10 [Dissostichus eleginoides]